MQARRIRVNGIVQGVGFRPFVARLARDLGLTGWVENDTRGVEVWAEHENAAVLDEFARRLRSQAPPAARVQELTSQVREPIGYTSFEIRQSPHAATRDTLVSPDLATCDDCLRELFDPHDRRYHYPFINCTNCGPRFTIIEDLPYDRATTSMRRFEMCPACAAEYADERDRRYHAQPNACFACGPRLWWWDSREPAPDFDAEGALVPDVPHLDRRASDALVEHAGACLEDGEVVAVKGLGGWHLSCDARSDEAVTRLRKRKHRPTKPLAIMVESVEAARELCHVSAAEERLLESPARPIVLLRRKRLGTLAAGVAGLLSELGVMLPATPVQHLIVRLAGVPLVMTSGNRSGEPIVATDQEAKDALGGIADGFLGNNRAIVARYDDSVVRVLDDGTPQMVRRARGFAPMPLMLDGRARREGAETPAIFAAGSEQKATFAFLDGRRAFVSQHLGDLERVGSWRAWETARERYEALFGLGCQTIACDPHPEYLASKWARQTARERDLPLVEVQHHHAHIAAVMGENDLDGRVIGVALDGTGYGSDGTIWGGELLVASRADFERLWHLPAFRLPGGAAAIRNPRRTAYAVLRAYQSCDDPFFSQLGVGNPQFAGFIEGLEEREVLDQMLERGVNSPVCTSMGRLFDAVAALLGVCEKPGYDGEAACLLEAAARRELAERDESVEDWAAALSVPARRPRGKRAAGSSATGDVATSGASPNTVAADPAPARTAPAGSAPAGGAGSRVTALSFHRGVIRAIIGQCERARERTGLDAVALGGGCMVNRLVSQGLKEGLRRRGFDVYANRELPPNDGCISYGQLIVARARTEKE